MDARRRALLIAGSAWLVPAARAEAPAESLWPILRRGGSVILIRHASTTEGAGDPPGYTLDDCATQRNLSEAGREEAGRIGERIRAERVPIARVYTSPWCRCRDTARLAFGKAEDWAPLGSTFDTPHLEGEATATVKKRILGYSIAKPRGNVVMVTHNVNIAALSRQSVATGEMVLMRPDGCCNAKPTERLKV